MQSTLSGQYLKLEGVIASDAYGSYTGLNLDINNNLLKGNTLLGGGKERLLILTKFDIGDTLTGVLKGNDIFGNKISQSISIPAATLSLTLSLWLNQITSIELTAAPTNGFKIGAVRSRGYLFADGDNTSHMVQKTVVNSDAWTMTGAPFSSTQTYPPSNSSYYNTTNLFNIAVDLTAQTTSMTYLRYLESSCGFFRLSQDTDSQTSDINWWMGVKLFV